MKYLPINSSGPRVFRWFAIALRASCLLLILFGTPVRAEQIIRLGFPGPANGMWGQLADALTAKMVKQGIKIEHYPLITLGGSRFAVELVQKKQLDMAAIDGVVLAHDIPQFDILNLPFLATNIGQARAIIKRVGPSLEKFAEAKGLRILGYTWIVGTFASNGSCVLKPEDIKGGRVMDGPPLFQVVFREAGASAVPLAYGEIYPALQAGLSRNGLFSVEFIVTQRIAEVTTCLTNPAKIAFMVLPVVLIAQQNRWLALSENERNKFAAAVAELEVDADKAMTILIIQAIEGYKKRDKKPIPMDGKALGEWRELVIRLYREISEKIEGGTDLLKAALAARESN